MISRGIIFQDCFGGLSKIPGGVGCRVTQGASPDARALFAQAVVYHQAGRLDEAIACYRQALLWKPGLAAAHNNLGNALCEQGKLEEAEASYRQALALQPHLASAHNNLGTVLFERDKLDDAVRCYRAALALEPTYAAAHDNLGAAFHRQGKLAEAEASIRRALAIKPDFAEAHDNLGTLLWEQGKLEEAEACTRRALALAPGFTRALSNLGAMLEDQGQLNDAITAYRQLLQIHPQDSDGLNGLARMLAAQGDASGALETILQSLAVRETANAKQTFVGIAKQWTNDKARHAMARALTEAWTRPDDLARAAARLIKQNGHSGTPGLADDELLLALLVSTQNADIELERFLTRARRALLEAATKGEPEGTLAFYAALAQQCFINEYVFFRDAEELQRASNQRDFLTAALSAGTPISALQLLAVAAYFPLHALSGATQLTNRTWPEEVIAVLVQQIREPQEEAQLRAAIPRLTAIEDSVSRLVRSQYEENPYPRWVRIPLTERPTTIAGYLRQKFPFAAFQRNGGSEFAELLSAGCGTGQLALEIAQSVNARVLAMDLSLSSLGYAARKARELGLTGIEFAQGDLLELDASGRSFDVVECSGVLHHLADPFAGWRKLLSLLRPGGFMVVGFYSEAARRGIVEARRFIAERGYGTSADDIRRCRQDLLDLDLGQKLGAGFGDFFGVSSCRDLLFHVQEQRLHLSAIAAFLRDNGLTFLGFETSTAVLQAYRRCFPDDPGATNLSYWESFENENRDTFSGMYRFWIQKPGAF